MLTGFDVFKQDAFSDITLTAAIEKIPFKPTLLGDLKLFDEYGITTTSLLVEERSGQLTLIADSPRGAPGVLPVTRSLRKARSFQTRHLVRESNIMADEIQNVRLFGQVDAAAAQLETAATVTAERMRILSGMHDFTAEYHRLGAVKGQVLDADGTTVLVDLFTEFGVTQQTMAMEIEASDTTTDVRNNCVAVRRMVQAELGGSPYTGLRGICSPSFFDALIAHPNVKLSYQYQEGIMLRQDLGMTGFMFGGIIWQEYRGAFAPQSFGASDLITADSAYVFPEGAMTEDGRSIFRTAYAPADFIEAVNTVGQRLYAKMAFDPEGMNRFVKLHTQSNPLSICVRPRCVVLCTIT